MYLPSKGFSLYYSNYHLALEFLRAEDTKVQDFDSDFISLVSCKLTLSKGSMQRGLTISCFTDKVELILGIIFAPRANQY